MSYYENVPRWIREIPWRLKTQEIWDEAVWKVPGSLSFVPNCFKTEGLCIKESEEVDAHLIAYPIT